MHFVRRYALYRVWRLLSLTLFFFIIQYLTLLSYILLFIILLFIILSLNITERFIYFKVQYNIVGTNLQQKTIEVNYMAKCRKTCNCEDCELLREEDLVIINTTKGIEYWRRTAKGYSCGARFGFTLEQLKNNPFDDDFIFIEG